MMPKSRALADRYWPNVKLSSSSEKNDALAKYAKLIKSGSGRYRKRQSSLPG
jgi:hypothetical protein